MHRHRILAFAAIGLCAALWTYACGDGATEPPSPPPDPPRPATVAVTPATVRLTALGATEQLTAEVRDQNGNAMAGTTVTWASSAAAVATVSGSGLVTAAGNGTATITATAGSASGSATVTVAQEVSAVAVTPAAGTVVTGDTLRLEAEAADANGHLVPGAELDWASSDTLVAVVDDAGLVTGIGAGEAEVTATAAGVTGRAALAVVAPAPTAVAVTPDTVMLTALGQTAQLAAVVRDQIGRVIEDVGLSWSSADTTIAAVDSAGLVTAIGGGATSIAAMAGGVSGIAVVTVMQSAGSVVVSPTADTVALGDTLRLAAQAFDENGHPVEVAGFRWSSSDASVATVDGSGLVTGIAEGTAAIVAAAGSGRGTAQITVENPDRAALVALYNATDGPNWVNNENWLTDAALGEWYGVATDDSGRVVRLDLSGRETQGDILHGLAGPIPPQLGSLTNLTLLNLKLNALSGSIPAELGNLSNLARLDLSENNLTGPIPPELGNLANLSWADLRRNALTGSIPPALGSSRDLVFLRLDRNDLTGTLPPELSNLVNLERLDLGENNLTGLVPRSFLLLRGLHDFRIDGNKGLCLPGTSAFVAWLQGIRHNGVSCNAGDVSVLETLYELTGGTAWAESAGWLGSGAVEEWYGVTADSLGRVTALDLTRNGLVGHMPPALGDLVQMTVLRIGSNALSGRLPLLLARVPLQEFSYADTELCAPADASFQTWLDGIASHQGTGVECGPPSDREILEILYVTTDGPNWASNDNWLSDAPLKDWDGLVVDGRGRVAGLVLLSNGLAGPIPPELGSLTNLTELNLYNNALTGPIPPEIGNSVELRSLNLGANDLSDPIPRELGNLARLSSLILVDNNLSGAIPPELGSLASVTDLRLDHNALTGPIPHELGSLASVTNLRLDDNALTGPIPHELGGLQTLERLYLDNNALIGSIPGDLGQLASLERLYLHSNKLNGAIPGDLGQLASLERLYLHSNNLNGAIPGKLGQLASLKRLRLQENALTGPMPGALGQLASLEQIVLNDNALTGPIPPELSGMASLQGLYLTNNPGLTGPLPAELTALRQLDELLAEGTSLCVPSDPGFEAWLAEVYKRRIATCVEGGPPAAYLVQAVQSLEFPVPLVADERALLRVFPTANQATSQGMPAVRARFFVSHRETHVVDIAGKSTPIPTGVDESSLAKSANAEIPGHVIQPGLEMVIEVDPDGELDSTLGVARRIPETGRLALDVRAMPPFDLTVIPFIWSETHDSSTVDLVGAMAADPDNHELLSEMRTLLPVAELEVTAHEPVRTSTNDAYALLSQTEAIRVLEGGTGYYMGTMPGPVTGAGGVARLAGKANFSLPRASTIAHELGHNLSLLHAPCGGPDGLDSSYPYSDGSIGAWGYDFRDGGSLVRPSRPDLMSYCGPEWVSDYSFSNTLRYRLRDEDPPTATAVTAAEQALLLWGGITSDSLPFLNPAFVVEAPPALPDSAGAYAVTGRTADARELFSLRFAMPETADGDGSSGFAFVVPVQPGWDGNLASITLMGPGGSFTLGGDSDIPVAILRNPRTGQVRGILRNPPPSTPAAADAVGESVATGLEVLYSRGIPGAEAWRR